MPYCDFIFDVFSDFESWDARVRRMQIWSGRLVGHSLGIFFGFGNECLWYRVVFVGRTRYLQWGNLVCGVQFFGATKHLSEEVCPSVGRSVDLSVRWSVGPWVGPSVCLLVHRSVSRLVRRCVMSSHFWRFWPVLALDSCSPRS